METMFSPSPSTGIKWGNHYEVPFLCFFPVRNPIVSGRPCPERERMGLGWLLLFIGVFPGQGFLQFSLLSSNHVNPELQMKCSWQPRWTYLGELSHLSWGSLAPAKQGFHITSTETSTLSKTALLCEVLLGKEMSWEFFTVQCVTKVDSFSLTLTQISGPLGGPGSQCVERWFPVQALKLLWI